MTAQKRKRARTLWRPFAVVALVAAGLVGSFWLSRSDVSSEKTIARPLFPRTKPVLPRETAIASFSSFLSPSPGEETFQTPDRTALVDIERSRDLSQRDFLITTYHEWARRQPEPAFTSATKIQDPIARETAIQSALSGWARTDPQGLAELALKRPDGPEKTAALTKALREWMHRDPWKAGDWIAAHESTIAIAEKMFRDDRR